MKKAIKFIVLLLCIVSTSCEKEEYEWEEVKPITLKYSNVQFDVLNKGYGMRTTIPYTESTISISPEYTGKDHPIVRYITVDGIDYFAPNPYEEDYVEENPILKGDWGEISYDYSQPDFTIHINLTENNSASRRTIRVDLTAFLSILDIDIIQEPNPNITE